MPEKRFPASKSFQPGAGTTRMHMAEIKRGLWPLLANAEH